MFRKTYNLIKSQPKWRLILATALLAGAGYWLSRGTEATGDAATFAARRGPLQISVLEGGTMQAINSQEIKCEVRVGMQGSKLLRIVDEGYLVTDEDVKNGKVLVELDSSDLEKQQVQQEILFQTAVAALADARQGYDIQVIQNTSDILAAEQKARFARMDFQKFLGSKAADEVIASLGIEDVGTGEHAPAPLSQTGLQGRKPVLLASLETPHEFLIATNPPATNETAEALAEVRRPSSINFMVYTNKDRLDDGEAKQKLRKFQDDLQVAEKELGQAKLTRDGTRRLHEKGFVTQTDLQRDEIAYENYTLKVKTAETARDLFLTYDFLKTAEETLSKYSEAVRELDRARKSAIAKLAQADARLKSATAQFNVQLRQRQDLELQISKCIIKAERPGLVIYGRAGDDGIFFGGGEERIREGASVRERQTILTIPDLSKMGVRVKIHETYIKKVKAGQQVRMTVDAFPDKILEGEVTKVSPLPDSQNRWMNPDMKVYNTTIAVEGANDWLKPGMSTKVEILVDRLEDVVYVPIQAVVPEGGRFFCHVANGRTSERRVVTVGQFNDEFIEIADGVREGDLVLLNPPRPTSTTTEEEPRGTNGAPVRSQPGSPVQVSTDKAGSARPTGKTATKS